MEKITAKEAREAFTLQSAFAPAYTDRTELVAENREILLTYLEQQVAIEESDAAAVPLSRG